MNTDVVWFYFKKEMVTLKVSPEMSMYHAFTVFGKICSGYTHASLVSSEFVLLSTRNLFKDMFLRSILIGLE